MTIVIPFISHIEKKLTSAQAIQIAEILGLPAEISLMSLTIDENLTLRAFARGVSSEMPFHYNSVPFNWLSYEADTPSPVPPPDPDDLAISEIMNGVEAGTIDFRDFVQAQMGQALPENSIVVDESTLPLLEEAATFEEPILSVIMREEEIKAD